MIATIQMQWLGIGIAALVRRARCCIVVSGPPSGRRRTGRKRARGAASRRPDPARSCRRRPRQPWRRGRRLPCRRRAQAATPLDAAGSDRRRDRRRGAPLVAAPAGSFLDEPLANGFEGLGKVAAPARPEPVLLGPFPVDPFGSHEDIFPLKNRRGEPDAEPADTASGAPARPRRSPAERRQRSAANRRSGARSGRGAATAEPAAPSAEPKPAATAAEVAPGARRCRPTTPRCCRTSS